MRRSLPEEMSCSKTPRFLPLTVWTNRNAFSPSGSQPSTFTGAVADRGTQVDLRRSTRIGGAVESPIPTAYTPLGLHCSAEIAHGSVSGATEPAPVTTSSCRPTDGFGGSASGSPASGEAVNGVGDGSGCGRSAMASVLLLSQCILTRS